MLGKSILQEIQSDRDLELSILTNIDLDVIQSYKIASPDAIRICDGVEIKSKNDIKNLYKHYSHLNLTAYLKTLMYTSINGRHPELFKLIIETSNKKCLDFGSGVGTHAIAMAENNNNISILDVDGPLMEFAKKRLKYRGINANILLCDDILQDNCYDIVICTDVLEHVFDPIHELVRIHHSMKSGGILHLQVSKMIKNSSGHFKSSINKWKISGLNYLNRYFTTLGQTIYEKI